MDFRDYLREQAELHPAMEPQDVMKMIYQASFGAEHLLEDAEAARKYLIEELEQVTATTDIPLFEDISEDMCRVNLGAWKGKGLPADWLFKIFALSAGNRKDGKETFMQLLEAADDAAARGWLEFTHDQWQAYKKEYLKDGIRAVHHSEAYRKAERPAYRLAARCFCRLAPVLEKAAGLGPAVIAIDGRAASGKTTMAGMLRLILGGSVIRMDDFFLPPDLRTEERFSQPGGNVHYERFAEEVLPHLGGGGAFTYSRFDCSRMAIDPSPVKVPASPWRIVEGSYSHHPKLGEYADLKVFSDVDPKTQMERIIIRNGAEMAKVFSSRWIPLEEEYFSAYKIAQKAGLKI